MTAYDADSLSLSQTKPGLDECSSQQNGSQQDRDLAVLVHLESCIPPQPITDKTLPLSSGVVLRTCDDHRSFLLEVKPSNCSLGKANQNLSIKVAGEIVHEISQIDSLQEFSVDHNHYVILHSGSLYFPASRPSEHLEIAKSLYRQDLANQFPVLRMTSERNVPEIRTPQSNRQLFKSRISKISKWLVSSSKHRSKRSHLKNLRRRRTFHGSVLGITICTFLISLLAGFWWQTSGNQSAQDNSVQLQTNHSRTNSTAGSATSLTSELNSELNSENSETSIQAQTIEVANQQISTHRNDHHGQTAKAPDGNQEVPTTDTVTTDVASSTPASSSSAANNELSSSATTSQQKQYSTRAAGPAARAQPSKLSISQRREALNAISSYVLEANFDPAQARQKLIRLRQRINDPQISQKINENLRQLGLQP